VIAGAGVAAAVAAGGRVLYTPLHAAAGEAAPASGRSAGPAAMDRPWKHAVGDPRGSDVVLTSGKAKEARFGAMFKTLDSYGPPDELLHQLAVQMGEPAGAVLDNPNVLAGDTFLGQFIDHDMTHDTTPMPDQQVDPKGLVNFDSPFFDLAVIYGRGPGLDPQLYEADGKHLKIVRNAAGVDDLPRAGDGTAYIGDPRNDENLILMQLHLMFCRFHNRVLDAGLATTLSDAQRLVRWHFQWIIVHQFLPTIAGQPVVNRYLSYDKGKAPKVKNEYYKPGNKARPMMPIEYAVAAYRFGHSMVRAGYTLNASGGAPMFDPAHPDLRGSRPLPADRVIEWWRFYDVPGAPTAPRNQARLIDTKLSLPLLNLPPTVVTDPMVSLAERNLVRGKRLGLPAGQDVAAAMGIPALSPAELALPDGSNPDWGGKAPLWYYILRESEVREGGLRLGQVGARIVAEVILGILALDRNSYLNAESFAPARSIAPSGTFGMGDLVAFATAG
jgi:hypothetical protein